MGMKHTMALMLRVENGVHQYVGFMRQLDRPHFSNHERDFAQRLMPDLTRATQLRDRTGHLARRATLGLAALDSLRQGIAVVDAQCCVHYANAAMERLIASPRPLHVRKGRIGCVDDAVHAQLLQLATAACARPARAGALILQGDGRTGGVDPVSLAFLAGATSDFSDELIGARFTIDNPNASSSCGCGTSFSI